MKFFLITLTLMTSASWAKSQSSPELLSQGACRENIVKPEGANPNHFMSKDCKTVYVLPKLFYSFKVKDIATFENTDSSSCELLESQKLRLYAISDELLEVLDLRVKLVSIYLEKLRNSSTLEEEARIEEEYGPQIKFLEQEFEDLKKEEENLFKIVFNEDPGAKALLDLRVDMDQEVQDFARLNQNSEYKFKAVPFKNIFFSVAMPSPKVKGKTVVDINVKGLEAKSDDSFKDSKLSVIKEGIKIEALLSQPSVCHSIKNARDLATSFIVTGNLTYEISTENGKTSYFTSGISMK